MSVAEQIFERVKSLPIEVQQQVLNLTEQLASADLREEAALEVWRRAASESAMRAWPHEDWSEEFKAWEAKQAKNG